MSHFDLMHDVTVDHMFSDKQGETTMYKIMFFSVTITVPATTTLQELADKVEKYGKIVQFFQVKG